MSYVLLFLEGIITFISPCILPMLPIYLSYFIGEKTANNKNNKALVNSIGFVLGFTIIFVLLGLGVNAIGLNLNKYLRELNIVSGIIMIIMGLNHTGIIKIGFLQRSYKLQNSTAKKDASFFSTMLFGMVFSIGWTPCVGPFLGSALMMAANSNHILNGVFMLLSYSLGFGIPFILSALLIDSLKSTFDFIKRNYKVINIFSGIVLIIVGVLMITGYLNLLLSLLTF